VSTRPYRDIAAAAKEKWAPEVHEFAANANAILDAEVTAQVNLGRQLTELRKSARLTQVELAARAAMDQAEVSRIERGLGNPTRDTLVRLATAVDAQLVLLPQVHEPA
jgi:DNA-binding XRE family transcriptional regulator